jgi:hypothetical protein
VAIETPEKLLDGTPDWALRTAVVERLVMIKYYLKECDDPNTLKWIRRQLSQPYAMIQNRLREMGELEEQYSYAERESQKGVATNR